MKSQNLKKNLSINRDTVWPFPIYRVQGSIGGRVAKETYTEKTGENTRIKYLACFADIARVAHGRRFRFPASNIGSSWQHPVKKMHTRLVLA